MWVNRWVCKGGGGSFNSLLHFCWMFLKLYLFYNNFWSDTLGCISNKSKQLDKYSLIWCDYIWQWWQNKLCCFKGVYVSVCECQITQWPWSGIPWRSPRGHWGRYPLLLPWDPPAARGKWWRIRGRSPPSWWAAAPAGWTLTGDTCREEEHPESIRAW